MTACTWPLGRDAGQDSAAEYHHLQCRDHSGKRAGNGNLHLASWLRWRQGQCSKIPSPTAPRSCWRDGLAAAPLCRGAEQLDGLGRSQRPRLVTPLHILPGRPSPWEPSPGLGLTLRPSTHGSFLPDWVRWDWIRVERICTLPHSLHILPGRPSPWELSPGLGLTLPHMGTFSRIGLDGIGLSGGHDLPWSPFPYGMSYPGIGPDRDWHWIPPCPCESAHAVRDCAPLSGAARRGRHGRASRQPGTAH